MKRCLTACVAVVLVLFVTRHALAGEIYVFAAASLHDAVEETGAEFEKQTGDKIVANFASTATLAQQIVAGSPADVFISANEKWMDHVEAKAGLAPGTRRDFVKNDLVVIVPVDSKIQIAKPEDLIGPACDRLAIGEPGSVPAGIYARQSLEKLGLWAEAQQRALPALDVRAAMVYVERNEVPCGIVYSTDALISKKVRTAYTLPEDSHEPIVYPIAQPAGAKNPDGAKRFLDYLKTGSARAIFAKYGFVVIGAN